jgi:DNA-binding transcriptional ArsR family regulator
MPSPSEAQQAWLNEALRAISNPHRLKILTWLIEPKKNFPPQSDGDLVEDGVCVGFITDKTGLTQPTVTTHMQALAQAGLVTSKKIKNWVYYKPNGSEISRLIDNLSRALGRA